MPKRTPFRDITVTMEDDEGEETAHELPAMFEACPTCEGKGSHVNPSIDDQGISPQEFAEDPDFEESYFSGAYNVTCYQCQGNNVVPIINREQIKLAGTKEDVEALKAWDDALEAEAGFRAEEAAERRMGC